MKIFQNEAVEQVRSEIQNQLANQGKATRKSVVKALGWNSAHEFSVAGMFGAGLFPEYRSVRQKGIVSSDYQTLKEKDLKDLKDLKEKRKVQVKAVKAVQEEVQEEV